MLTDTIQNLMIAMLLFVIIQTNRKLSVQQELQIKSHNLLKLVFKWQVKQ